MGLYITKMKEEDEMGAGRIGSLPKEFTDVRLYDPLFDDI